MRTLTFNRVIGVGAMGTVYHAELKAQAGFVRQCAVKVIKISSPDQDHFRARMRDEARLLGMLQDEHILGVSELVQVAGRDCVVMEYVEGVDLSELLQAHTVPPRALAEFGAEVAGTLHRAHASAHPRTGKPLEVIHRDVKPANCMITARGGVRLLDFGVARAVFASRESETHGLVLGTLNYFPPEILAGAEPTPAVDIYGLGLTLWECATGREWGSPQVHRRRFERRVDQRLAEVGEDYAPLVPVLRQILRWEPDVRPPGTQVESELLAAVEACTGVGLRAWSRDVVPPILEIRVFDPTSLVGETHPIEASMIVTEAASSEAPGPDPRRITPPVSASPRHAVGETQDHVSPDMPTSPLRKGADGRPERISEDLVGPQVSSIAGPGDEDPSPPVAEAHDSSHDATTAHVPAEVLRSGGVSPPPPPRRGHRDRDRTPGSWGPMLLLAAAGGVSGVVGVLVMAIGMLVGWIFFA